MHFINATKSAVNVVRSYPAAWAGIIDIGVTMAARFGFHVNSTQLTYVVTVATVVLSAFVHSLVTPTNKAGKL
jgi:hypothetical protein